MTSRSAQMKAYREYQEALQEVYQKRPRAEWQDVYSDDRSEKARISYDPEHDILTLQRNIESNIVIPGKFFRVFQSALDNLLEER